MEPLKTEKSKGSFAIDANVIKDIQAQIASLTQRDELKKVGMMRPYPLKWDSVSYPPKFKPPTLHTYDGKSSPNQHIYYLLAQSPITLVLMMINSCSYSINDLVLI